MTNTYIKIFFLFFTILLTASCKEDIPKSKMKITNIAIIPLPNKIVENSGEFSLNASTKIILPNDSKTWASCGIFLQDMIKGALGCSLAIQIGGQSNNAIIFKNSSSNKTKNKEAYQLSVKSKRITISANTANGAFYGIQTLRQLMPSFLYSRPELLNKIVLIPNLEIEDEPRFSYRGMHLDVCRHFFSVDEVKRYIDLMAIHKYNKFHWHLTEDQAWRIEIKQYPKLTEIGAFRKETLIGHSADQPEEFDGKRYGGFYTQEQIKEIIQYATDRFITIIPEIEMPGHAQAAIAAYPELGCQKQNIDVWTKWGISENVYCPTEETFTFLENVLNEAMDLFPSEYIHIGGDECPKKQWKESTFCQQLIKKEGLKDELELQSYFIKRIEKIINAKGKKMIGWDEILEGGLSPNATVMSWRGTKGGMEAATDRHDVIMTPTSHCYFDHYQSLANDEPLAIGGFLPLNKVYSFEPIPENLEKNKRQHIIGAQANLWTEYISNEKELDYMAYPRASAMAEVLWSKKEQRNFDDFISRMKSDLSRLQNYGVNVATTIYDVRGSLSSKNGKIKVDLKTYMPNTQIRYTLDGSEPGLGSTYFDKAFEIDRSFDLRASGFINGYLKGKAFEGLAHIHKAVSKSITLKKQAASKYSKGGPTAIINGIIGNDKRFADNEWLGFSGDDFEAVIDLGSPTDLKNIRFRFFKAEGHWIYLPKKVNVYTSNDGKKYLLAGKTSKIETDKKSNTTIAEPQISLNANAQYVKIIVDRFGIIPKGLIGSGHESWLFIDEIILE